MKIVTAKESSRYSGHEVSKITDSETSSAAVEVPWGFYLASQGRRILTRVMTGSINSCFAYFFWDKERSNFFFAHVSTDGEAASVASLVKKLSGNNYSDQSLFVCVTGVAPQSTTVKRINYIVENINKAHRFFNAKDGGVTFDLSLESITETGGAVAPNTRISRKERTLAMIKPPKLPLEGMQVHDSWVE
ncbi:hypothetical protein EDC56_1133 [Sinobacterium caligoides]|uniref:Uncharacterized protein n=1 Tax=Sinobacterium caligoides TaxID=933926 RepID=A0A3N2E0F5_9GAMM|nr:hypothetical protein [Sinobacterium caligoides]ROS05591.1 hypothetical protein EDC56_1133 [Sinobacterium caligoides]